MPSTLNTFASNEVSLRFREPFVTAGINRRNAVVQPRGIYKGFSLGASATNLTVTISPLTFNGVTSESVAVVYGDAYTTTSNDLAFTIRRNTAFNVDVSTYPSQTIVLGLFVTHVANSVTGPSTIAEVRGYTLAEYNALGSQDKLTFVPMGQVVVPASGVIAAASITPTFRMEAWENIASGAYPWSLVTKNSGFEGASLSSPSNRQYMMAHWELAQTLGSTSKWSASGSPLTSGNFSLTVNNTGGAETFSGTLIQRPHIPMIAGQLIRTRLAYKILSADTTTTATIAASLMWLKTDGSTTTTSFSLATTLTGSLAQLDQIVGAPTLASELLRVTLTVTGYGCGAAAGDVVAFEDFQVYVENQTIFRPQRLDDQNSGQRFAHPLILDVRDPTPATNAPMFYFDSASPASEGRAIMDRVDQSTGLVPVLHLFGRLKVGDKNAATNTKPLIRAKFDSTQTFPTLVGEYGNTDEGVSATKATVRHYVSQNGDFIVTVNAKADTSFNWSKDISGQAATKTIYEAVSGKRRHQIRLAANNAIWADSAWDNEIAIDLVASALLRVGGTLTVQGGPTDGASAIGLIASSGTTLANATAKILSVQNNTTEKFALDLNGKVIVPTGGAAAVAGRSVLINGTTTISTTAITATSVVILTRQVAGGTVGLVQIGTVVAGTSFVINSVQPGTSSTIQAADTSTIGWYIIN